MVGFHPIKHMGENVHYRNKEGKESKNELSQGENMRELSLDAVLQWE